MDSNSGEELIYQSYELKTPDGAHQNEDDESDKSVLYFTFEEGHEQKGLMGNVNDENGLTTNVKLITLEDGTMLMTSEEEHFDAIQPHLITEVIEGDKEKELGDGHVQAVLNPEGVNCQIIQLPDGSQAVLLNNEEIEINDADANPAYICTYKGCDKAFTSAHYLKSHLKTHSKSKFYMCLIEGCDKKFSTSYSLKAHVRTHTGEKPYGCDYCGKHFKTSGDLLKHVRIHKGIRPFLCPVEGCGKSFTTSNIRKVHIRSHTGERPYSCDHPNCGKAFSSATNYKNHIRIHSGEKPYLCAVEGCGKRFTEYSSLYKHNTVHQTKRPFACNICGFKCKSESALKLHKRVKHNAIIIKDGTEIIINYS